MPEIPHDPCLESSLALIADPYGFISKRCRQIGSNLFRTRLLLRTNICMMGRDAAELFYDDSRFSRRGAVLRRFEQTLTGQGGVQGMDDQAHRHRKQMLMSLVTAERIAGLAVTVADRWQNALMRWRSMDSVVLYDEIRELLCRSVCAWSGVPVDEQEFHRLSRDLAAMYEYATLIGPRHYWARHVRRKAERWAAAIVAQIRAGNIKPPPESAAHTIAWHRDLAGGLLEERVAAVELLNVLRPTVAVSVYITLAALALHEHPNCRQQLMADGKGYAEMFAQEVRRFYPFFAAVAARVRHDFEWRGYHFPQGTRVILDLYGTNHDPAVWDKPEEFEPERFRDWNEDPFSFVPQGGGDQHRNHRCPGDQISVELLKVATTFLCERMRYEVPAQDLRLDLLHQPALPRSRFIIGNVREA